jgi:PAS domain S-box-containing protein
MKPDVCPTDVPAVELYRLLVEQSGDGLFVTDESGRLLFGNARCREILRCSPEELAQLNLDELCSRESTEPVTQTLRRLPTGQFLRLALSPRRESGDGLAVEVVLHLMPRGGFHGVLRDVTDQKLADEALARDRHLSRTLIETIPDRIYVKDAEARFILNNIAHLRALGARTQDDARGKTDFDFRPAEVAAQCMADDQQVLQTGQPLRNREEATVLPDGSRVWTLVTKVPLRNADGKIVGLVGISRDITEHKEAAEKVQRYAARLEASNRDLQDFAHVASHDLQEPLRKIQAFGDRLRAKCGDALGETGRDYLTRMSDAAGRMQTLINDLLSFSRVTTKAQPFVPVDLDKVLRAVLDDLEVRIEQTQARIEAGPLGTIEADPLQMRQLFQNLIGNALKFHKENVPPLVRIHSQRLNGELPPRLEIVWVDNGIGFDQKYADRIFGIFQRLHGRGQYEGSGVGLAICKKIVERHGGTITTSGKLGEGATFVATLPVAQPKEKQAP